MTSPSCSLCSPVPFLPVAGDGDVRDKTAALKRIIQLMLNGERFPSLLMPVIQYVMPQRDHTLKKLLLIFWEIVPKTTPDGKLLHEMILVCDAYRKVSGDTVRIPPCQGSSPVSTLHSARTHSRHHSNRTAESHMALEFT